MRFLYYFNFESNYDVSDSKGSCILLNKNISFNENETIKNGKSHTWLSRNEPCALALAHKNRKLKVKL